jgi:lipopolysaccharide export system protein LptA
MPIDIPRLRYWFAAAAIMAVVLVVGFYFYVRIHPGNVVAELPGKLPSGVQQNTQGFSLSKSEGGHTLFTVRAESATQYKEGDRAELKNVRIVVYGRESNRFDQIYGNDFLYEPQTGNVIGKGLVDIDLQSYNTLVPHPDQAPPQELKNPIHLVTRGLVFNQKTGDANTTERVDFRTPEATGWAVGAHYSANQSELLLDSDIHITTLTPNPAEISAQHGIMSKQPRQVVLYQAHLVRQDTSMEAPQLTIFLRPDDTIGSIVGTGGIDSTTTGASVIHVHAPDGVLYLQGHRNELQSADLTGHAEFDTHGASTMYGSADKIHMEFAGHNLLQTVHMQGSVRMVEPPKPAASVPQPSVLQPAKVALAGAPGQGGTASSSLHGQTIELTADAVDFWLDRGNQLRRAETSENAQITLTPQAASSARPSAAFAGTERTVVTARKFYAAFRNNRLDSLIGKPDARVVSYVGGQGNRVSTSQLLDVLFSAAGEISQITQRDNFQYREALPNGTERAGWAQLAVYSMTDDTLTLNGSPRIIEGGMTTTAHVIHMDRKNGDANADGNVKTTYNDVKPQAGGALLASGEPTHVTAHSMTASRTGGVAHYFGDARLWQGVNTIEAPVIDFDRDKRTVIAIGGNSQEAKDAPGSSLPGRKPVQTLLSQQDKTGKRSPIKVTSNRLNYSDYSRVAQFEGSVLVRSIDGSLTADHAAVYFFPVLAGTESRSPIPGAQSGQVDKMIAEGNVVLEQPQRRAAGRRLTYTAALDEYNLVGGPPTFFDAEHGTVNGDSLTFYNRDDRVLVEGGATSRAVTHTRVSK